jgi:hypothetical protein
MRSTVCDSIRTAVARILKILLLPGVTNDRGKRQRRNMTKFMNQKCPITETTPYMTEAVVGLIGELSKYLTAMAMEIKTLKKTNQ